MVTDAHTATHTPAPMAGATGSASCPIDGLNIYVIGLGGIAEGLLKHLSMNIYSHDPKDVAVWLIDGDRFEYANRDSGRMSFHQLGHKAHIRETELATLFGDRVSFRPVPLYLTQENIESIIPPDEPAIIFLCVDNHGTRRLVSRYASRRAAGLTLIISGGNSSVEEDGGYAGNVQIHLRHDHRDLTNAIDVHHPEIAQADEGEAPNNDDPDCVQMALSSEARQIGVTNLAVASAMLNAFLAWQHGCLNYEEVYIDTRENRSAPRARPVLRSGGGDAE